LFFGDAGLAEYLGQKPRTIRGWRQTRGLPYCRLTQKSIVFRRADVDAWLAQHRVAVVAAPPGPAHPAAQRRRQPAVGVTQPEATV